MSGTLAARRSDIAPARLTLAVTLTVLVIAAALAGGCASGSAGVANVSPTDGAGLVSALCGQCHPIQRIETARKDRNGWTAAVARMESHGLHVTDQQRQSIIDYLTKRDGGS